MSGNRPPDSGPPPAAPIPPPSRSRARDRSTARGATTPLTRTTPDSGTRWRERVLQVETLRPETQLLLGAVVAQLVVAAMLIGVRNTRLPTIQSDHFAHTTATMPIAVFVACLVFSSAAWGLILAGAFRAGWEVRVAVVGIFLWVMVSGHDALGHVGAPSVLVCCLLLAGIVAVGVATWFPETTSGHRDIPNGEPPERWRTRRRLVPPLLIVMVGGVYLTAWLANKSAGHVVVFSDDVADQIANIQYILVPILVLAGSEFGSWSDFVADRVIRRIRLHTREGAFGALVVIGAGAILWDGLRASMLTNGGDVAGELVLAAGVGAMVAILFLVARPRCRWPRGVAFVALAVVAGVDATVGYIAERQLGHSDPLFDDKILGVSATFWIVAAVVALLALVVLRHRLPGPWVAAGCLVVMIGTIDGLTELDEMGTVIHPFGLQSTGTAQHLVTNAPTLGVEGLKSVAAMATVALVLYALASRALPRLIVPVSLLLTLTISLQLLTWVDLLFGKATDTTGRVALLPRWSWWWSWCGSWHRRATA